MQQASRVSDYTAFMFLGELVEFGATEKIFTTPTNRAPRTTSPAGSANPRARARPAGDIASDTGTAWGVRSDARDHS